MPFLCGPNVFGHNGALLTPKLVGTPLLGFPYFYCCITIVGHVLCFPFITGFGAMSTKTSTCSSLRLKRSPRNEMVHLYRSSTPLGKGVVRRPGLLLSLSKVTRVGLGNLIIRALADPYRSVQYYVATLRREVRGGGGSANKRATAAAAAIAAATAAAQKEKEWKGRSETISPPDVTTFCI